MKLLLSAFAALLLCTGLASAQQMSSNADRSAPVTSSPATARDVTGFVSPYTPGPGVNPKTTKSFPNPHPNLKPKVGGVVTDTVKYGPVMLSPGAPAEYGMGERYLSAPSQGGYDLQHESGEASKRTSGGFKLFSFEF